MQSPKTLLHIDGDAFFASVYQATHAEARGKPVAIGYERGMATAISYEAKKFGIKRGMLISEIRRRCPQCIIASSDYRVYQLFSNRMVDIVTSYTPYVERYSIDEVFADITGFDKIHKMSFEELGQRIKTEVEMSLGLTVSAGIASTKTLAKIASSFYKPSGFHMITPENTAEARAHTPVEDIWGIGPRLAIRLQALGIQTAEEFVQTPKAVIVANFPKPVVQTWYELQGVKHIGLSYGNKEEYQSIQKTRTVTPPTNNPQLLLSRIARHIESAFIKARRLNYSVKGLSIMLKSQTFHYYTADVKLSDHTEYPYLIREHVKKAFQSIYVPGIQYRTTGCTLYDLQKNDTVQEKLFDNEKIIKARLKNIYHLYEKNDIRFGSDLFDAKERPSTTILKLANLN